MSLKQKTGNTKAFKNRKATLSLCSLDPGKVAINPQAVSALKEQIRYSDDCALLLVRPNPAKKGRYLICDGHHNQYQALLELGMKEAPCRIWYIAEDDHNFLVSALPRLVLEKDLKKKQRMWEPLFERFDADGLMVLYRGFHEAVLQLSQSGGNGHD